MSNIVKISVGTDTDRHNIQTDIHTKLQREMKTYIQSITKELRS